MELANQNSTKKANCMILNYWYALNYGAALTCFGLQCLAEKLGFNAKIINYMPRFKNEYPKSFSKKFADKYLHLTEPVNNYEDFLSLNDKCNTFIVGSDQVWSQKHIKRHCANATQSIYLLDFVKNGNKRLSYSASFGVSTFQGDWEQENLFKHFIKQFDSISVREDDGIKILKDYNINQATQLVDGAFLIPKEELDKMTAKHKTDEKYIACFVLPYFKKENWYKKAVNQISQKLNLPIKYFDFNKTTTVEQWLAFIKNSNFVITDSYHGFVFSIIFNRPFVQVKNARTQSRFESVFRLFNMEDNSISKEDKIDLEKVFIERNWEKINKKIEEEVLKAENWLKKAFEIKAKDNSKYDLENFLLINSQLEKNKQENKIKILKDYKKIKFKYRTYKLIKIFTFGKKRKKIQAKIENYKEKLETIN